MTSRRNVIIASAGAVLAAGIVTVSAVAGAAPAATTNHTIKLIATQTATHNFSRSSAAEADTDRSRGKVIGYNVLALNFTKTGGLILGSFATQGGVLDFRLPLTNSKTLHGRITGGSGRFAGAMGTIAATELNNAGTKTAVTIVWHR